MAWHAVLDAWRTSGASPSLARTCQGGNSYPSRRAALLAAGFSPPAGGWSVCAAAQAPGHGKPLPRPLPRQVAALCGRVKAGAEQKKSPRSAAADLGPIVPNLSSIATVESLRDERGSGGAWHFALGRPRLTLNLVGTSDGILARGLYVTCSQVTHLIGNRAARPCAKAAPSFQPRYSSIP